MDAQGDFVITWQSNNQDGSGYGIYAQAYNAAGLAVGGTDEMQAIDFVGGFTGTFQLGWDTTTSGHADVSAPITFTGNATAASRDRERAGGMGPNRQRRRRTDHRGPRSSSSAPRAAVSAAPVGLRNVVEDRRPAPRQVTRNHRNAGQRASSA